MQGSLLSSHSWTDGKKVALGGDSPSTSLESSVVG